MKKEIKVWAMTMIAFWYWAPNQTLAQPDSIPVTTLREVVVTATKFPKNVSETGKVLMVIDQEQLSRSGGKDLSQVLNEQVGLVINGANSNPAKDKSVFLRGAAGKYTLILIDGIPVNDPSGIDGAFDLRLLSIDQIERIEILKGSQSTLYGTDAIAGVINIITKTKGNKPVSGSGILSYGSYNTLRANMGVSGSTNKIDYSIGFTRFQTEGLSEARDTTGTAGFDKDGMIQNALQASVGYKAGEKFNIRPFVRYNDFDGAFDAGAFVDEKDATYAASTLHYGLTSEFQYSKGSVSMLFAHNKTERSFTNMFGINDYDGRFNHGEVFVRHDLTSSYQLLSGVSYQHFNMIATNATVTNPAFDIISPYLSFFVNNLNGFSAELGGRYVNHTVYGNNFTFSFNPSFLINDRYKLFLNYGTGFKAPTLTQLYGPFGANEDLKPEESTSFEGGVQWFSANKRFDVRATWFQRNIDNIIAFTTGYVNWDKLNDSGVELEAFYKWKKLTLSGFYAYVEGEIITPVGSGTETKPNDLIRRPKHSFGLNAAWQLTDKLLATLAVKTFGQRNDLFFDFNTLTTSTVVLVPYQLLDVYIEYSLHNRMKLFGDFRNVLNQDYYEVYGYNTQRFNLMGGIRATF
ncbi:MAG: TonB-dependent receptor [Cyclobacteriaceae bacterium]|nr:TonB-dependent receptor [Cyclobacteriaceae bacterium]